MFFGLSTIRLYIIAAAVAAVIGIYFYWKSSIEQRALMEYNQRQLEQSLDDQRKLKAALDDIQQKQEDIIKKTEEDKKALDAKLSVVDNSLDTESTKKQDRPSSQILKNTVKQLRDISK